MTVIATASNPRFHVSRADIDRDGPTYTSTRCVTCARSTAPTAELFFITGADALARILSWKDALEMLALAHFVGVTRPGFELSDEHLPADTVTLVEVPAMAISSSACRARVAGGRAGLVPGARRCRAVHHQAGPLSGASGECHTRVRRLYGL